MSKAKMNQKTVSDLRIIAIKQSNCTGKKILWELNKKTMCNDVYLGFTDLRTEISFKRNSGSFLREEVPSILLLQARMQLYVSLNKNRKFMAYAMLQLLPHVKVMTEAASICSQRAIAPLLLDPTMIRTFSPSSHCHLWGQANLLHELSLILSFPKIESCFH